MILFPTVHSKDAERRAERILQHGVECHDQQLLSELWYALRSTESAQQPGRMRQRLNRIRLEAGDAIAQIKGESQHSGFSGTKKPSRRTAISGRRRAELERARRGKKRD